nr:MAG TPA: hypothetical protein [Caudoviricetes sp.]
MAANHFTASGIVTSYHVPIAFPALVYGRASSTPPHQPGRTAAQSRAAWCFYMPGGMVAFWYSPSCTA